MHLPSLAPLHHGGDLPAGRNWLQRFNDSEVGVLSANVMHSLGALLFVAGLSLYVYQARLVRRARVEGRAVPLGILNYAHVATLLGIGLNGVGGVMRLYESDHPSLDRLGDSLWVQVLLVKHLFLIAGVGLAVYLTWSTWRATRGPQAASELERRSPRVVAYAAASLATILLATVLGAVAGDIDLAADLGQVPEVGPDAEPMTAASSLPEADRLSVPGVIQVGTPARPESWTYVFLVAPGRTVLAATLTWSTPVASLNLTVRDPQGVLPPASHQKGETSWTVTVRGPDVRPGNWTLLVRGDQALNERYQLTALAYAEGSTFRDLERTVTVLGGRRFAEANLVMVGPRTLNYSWEIVGSDAKAYFDVHVHIAKTGKVEEPVAGEWNRHAGTYRHVIQETDGASLLWQNNGTTPVDIHLRIWGHFRLDAFFG